MFFSFGRKINGYDIEADNIEDYDEDAFFSDPSYRMFNSMESKARGDRLIKSKLKKIRENSRKQQKK